MPLGLRSYLHRGRASATLSAADASMTVLLLSLALAAGSLKSDFANPPDSARPWVYWYFMEGQMTRKGLTDDLEAMRKAGIGGGIFLEVDLGLPKGPVRYMSPEWRSMLGHAFREADRLGLAIALGTGPGWCGTGGPWVKPDESMQHLVSSATDVAGPSRFTGELPRPKPRTPFFGMGTLTPELRKDWEGFYRDEAVLAVPASSAESLSELDEKALVYRAPYSSSPGVKPYLSEEKRAASGIPAERVIDLTSKLKGGKLDWQVPPGKWTILRFGRTLTGQTTRPAPFAGLGFETDKFETSGIRHHLDTFVDAIVKEIGPRQPGRGLTTLHFDSWEMGAQNWSSRFRNQFKRRRGYDPLPYLPVMAGKIVQNVQVSERFLWDLRQTAQEAVIDSHIGTIKERSRRYGLELSMEPYDMNPTADMRLAAGADIPMGEFWSKGYGFDSEYSVYEAVSIGHTNGRPVIGAEAFTSDDRDGWLQHPASMKAQGDWALAAGINKFVYHRYQHQPESDRYPGLTMGPYGVHWERTQTWWDLVGDYHKYIARCQQMLRQGQPVADILYLAPEGAPNVFVPSSDATVGVLPDRRGYGFDGCDPETLIARATAKD
ncbi:glycosyl hydrolase, partial [bacterium]